MLTVFQTQRYRMESTVGEISMYTRPTVCVCSFSNHRGMAKSCLKMATVCSYQACVRVCVCVYTYHTAWHHIPEECNAPCHHCVNLKTHNYFISCLLTSQCVSSAHSICTLYSTERRMNATWLSLSWAFRSSRKWQCVITQVVLTVEGINKHNGITFIWHVKNYLPNDTASQPTQPESSARTLWELHILTTSSQSAV